MSGIMFFVRNWQTVAAEEKLLLLFRNNSELKIEMEGIVVRKLKLF